MESLCSLTLEALKHHLGMSFPLQYLLDSCKIYTKDVFTTSFMPKIFEINSSCGLKIMPQKVIFFNIGAILDSLGK